MRATVNMRKLEAIIRPSALDEVRQALHIAGVKEVNVTDVTTYGRHNNHVENYRGTEYSVDFLPQIKLDIVLTDELIVQCIDIIQQKARCGYMEDGKLVLTPLESVLQIQSAQLNNKAS